MENKVAVKEAKMGFEAPLVVSRIFKNCMYSGFFGRLDSERVKIVTERILEVVEDSDYDFLIVDLSNIDLIDSAIASHLIKISNTLRFSGIEVILCGIKGMVAQTMSVVDIQLTSFKIAKDLSKALEILYDLSGYALVEKE